MKKTIITVVGKDTVGIIAKVCNYLAENQVNIEDISQTIVQGYFNMMMVTDVSKSEKSNAELAKDLEEIGSSIGVVIRCQHEDIFNMMHRICCYYSVVLVQYIDIQSIITVKYKLPQILPSLCVVFFLYSGWLCILSDVVLSARARSPCRYPTPASATSFVYHAIPPVL